MAETIDFALTVTLTRALRAFGPAHQLDKSSRELQVLLNDCKIPVKYSCIYELTQNSDVHYHLILKLTYISKIRSYKIYIENLFRKSKVFGYVCVKPVTEYSKWVEYMSKDLQKTYNLLGLNPIIHDDYCLFEEDIMFGFVSNYVASARLDRAPRTLL